MNVESTENFQAEAVGRSAPASSDRAPPARRYRLSFENAISLSRFFRPFYRQILRIQEKLADVVADRSALLAKIEILEHDMQRVQKFAHHDELTGLPNRRLLEDRYRLAVAISERQRDNVALLFIDIDRFKSINDTFGHDFADRVLQQLALRLTACIRASDTACRYGGDEFVVLLSGNQGRAAAVATAAKIRERLSVPFVVDSQTIELEVSIGTALYPIDGPELSNLVKAADTEMYRRKGRSAGSSKSKRDRATENEAFTNEGAPPEEEP
jgi:diguanylate cyclase (GGDEF)-like protein